MLTSAGRETFVGAYAVEYLRQKSSSQYDPKGNWGIQAAVQRACEAANHSLNHEGCIYPLPWDDTFERATPFTKK